MYVNIFGHKVFIYDQCNYLENAFVAHTWDCYFSVFFLNLHVYTLIITVIICIYMVRETKQIPIISNQWNNRQLIFSASPK